MRPQPKHRSCTLDSFTNYTSYNLIQPIQRYDGILKTTTSWDSVRHDPELWSQTSEDCLIHFHAPLTSRRGPSLRIPLRVIEQTSSHYLLQECLQRPEAAVSPTTSDDDGSDSGYAGSQASQEGNPTRCAEMYIPAPAYATRKEAHLYHLGTRNFFAYLLDVPLLGQSLGIALSELWNRIQAWQQQSNDILATASDFRIYCQEQGYFNFAENPDYALAALCMAEKTRRKEFWREAFVNCAGMYERLEKSEEIQGVSSKTMMLVDRAAHEMDVHIRVVTRSLGTFLEDDLGPCRLGLSKALRDHLDRFRSTLHMFYVHQINGYFPPERDRPWDSRLWHGMRRDFRCLYAYLADEESSEDRANNRAAIGGICVMQNLQAFDERHGFVPLPHPLPLLPEQPVAQTRPAELRRSLGGFRIGRTGTSGEQKPSPSQLLGRASNTHDAEILGNRLVQEYIRFERLKMEEKSTIVEARKVRWLLVYSTLQMLISITQAPSDIRRPTGLSYPLCVPESNLAIPHWMEDEIAWQPRPESEIHSPIEPDTAAKTPDFAGLSIQPDCEAESADQFFSIQNSILRTDSDMSLTSLHSSPLRKSSTLSRTASIRSSVGSLHRSMVGSLSRKNSQRRASFSLPTWKAASVCETLIELQNGGGDAEDISPVKSTFSMGLSPADQTGLSTSEDTKEPREIPTLEMHQLSLMDESRDSFVTDRSQQESRDRGHPGWASSPALGETSASNFSKSERFSERTASQPNLAKLNLDITGHSPAHKRGIPPARKTTQLTASKCNNKRTSAHAGSYGPTGKFRSPPSHAMGPESPYSSDSCASSVYSESGGQAAEIVEEESRGRRRIRRHSTFGVIDEQIQNAVNPPGQSVMSTVIPR